MIVADAPDNPATTYHPVAVTKATATGNFTFNHLFVTGNIDNAATTQYLVTQSGAQTNVTIKSDSCLYQVYLTKTNDKITNLKMKKTQLSNQTVSYVNYGVTNSLTHNSIFILPGTVTMTTITNCQ